MDVKRFFFLTFYFILPTFTLVFYFSCFLLSAMEISGSLTHQDISKSVIDKTGVLP